MNINIETTATIFGYAGVLANLCWPLMKSRQYLLAGQVLACCFMFIHFMLLGAYTGAAVMGVAGFQAALANKALKAVAAPLDVSNRRMLRILRAACSRPLALRYTPRKNHAAQ
jgi:hypothetical protein